MEKDVDSDVKSRLFLSLSMYDKISILRFKKRQLHMGAVDHC